MTKKTKIISVDFGATFIKLGKLSLTGAIIEKDFFPTREFKTRDSLISNIVEKVSVLIGKDKPKVLGIGVGMPGPVDYDRGVIYNLTNVKGWKNVHLKAILKKKFKGLPVFIDNDANAAALGEAQWGAAKGCKDIVCVTLGSGVGGGLIIGGEVYRGRGYSAGEIGHLSIERYGPQCNCGGSGCMEAFVGNSYIVKDVIKRLKNGQRSIILKLCEGKYSKITPEVIDRASKKGDRFSINIWKEVGSNIGIGLSSIVNILNPEIIVIGGGVSKTGKILFDAIRKAIRENAMDIFTKDLVVKRAKFVEDAGIVGAAALVKKEMTHKVKV